MSAGTRTLERTRPRLTARAAVLLVTMTFLAILALVPARQVLDQRSRIAQLERQAATLERQNEDLRAQIATLHDPVELERRARECLGMVKPGEIAIVAPGQPPPTDC